VYRNIRYTLDRTHALHGSKRAWIDCFSLFLAVALKENPAAEAVGMGKSRGISKECGKGGKPVLWLSMLSTLCHFHSLLRFAFQLPKTPFSEKLAGSMRRMAFRSAFGGCVAASNRNRCHSCYWFPSVTTS
jgi:hypothetical protein